MYVVGPMPGFPWQDPAAQVAIAPCMQAFARCRRSAKNVFDLYLRRVKS